MEISLAYTCVPQMTIILNFDHSLPFCSPNNPVNHNFDKIEKTARDIIFLYMFTINENHKMYVSLDMKHDRETLLLFWTIFCPFTPLTTPKNQNFEKLKKAPHHFKQEYQKL